MRLAVLSYMMNSKPGMDGENWTRRGRRGPAHYYLRSQWSIKPKKFTFRLHHVTDVGVELISPLPRDHLFVCLFLRQVGYVITTS